MGSHFEVISGAGTKVKMDLPFRREPHFQGLRGSKNQWISTPLLEGFQRSSGVTFFDAFDDFGFPLGIQMDCILDTRTSFFEVRNFNGFRGMQLKGRRQRECPPEASECSESSESCCGPITACSPGGVRRILRAMPSAAGPLSTGNW